MGALVLAPSQCVAMRQASKIDSSNEARSELHRLKDDEDDDDDEEEEEEDDDDDDDDKDGGDEPSPAVTEPDAGGDDIEDEEDNEGATIFKAGANSAAVAQQNAANEGSDINSVHEF